MKKLLAATVLLLLATAWARAQNADRPSRGQGYAFIGPIVSNTQYVFNPAYAGVVFQPGEPPPADLFFRKRGGANAGFGGEVFVYRRLGVGAEFAWAGPNWTFGSEGLGVGSLDASYHFFRHGRLEPFVIGGYSLYFGDRTATQSGFNAGGGVNLWMAKHLALRLDLRDQGNINYFHSPFTNFIAFRFGLAFR